MDFNVTKYEKFVDKALDSTLQLTFKIILPLVKFWYHIKEECSQLPAKHTEITLSFSTTYLDETRFFSYPSNKTYFKRLDIEAVMRV